MWGNKRPSIFIHTLNIKDNSGCHPLHPHRPVPMLQQPQTISEGHRGTGNAALLWADQLSPSARNSAAALSLRLIFLPVDFDGAWSGVAIVMGASWMLCCCFLRDSLNTLMGCSLISTRATASPQLLLLERPKDSGDPGCSVELLLLALADDFLQSGESRLGVPLCWSSCLWAAAAGRSNEGRKMSCVKTIVTGVKRKLRSSIGRATEQSKTRALELEECWGWERRFRPPFDG